jgi:glutamine---fructose-6-phosphate transaminase (isomerizing)
MAAYQDHTWSEIQSQPDAWAAALTTYAAGRDAVAALLQECQPEQVLVTGCGSTYYLALAAAAALREIGGVQAIGAPASELWLSPQLIYPTRQRTLLVAVSRSGETTETLRAVEAFKAAGLGMVLTLTCVPESRLSQIGDLNLCFPEAREQSIAQTRAFSTLYLATLALAAQHGARADLTDALGLLPSLGRQLLSPAHDLARIVAQDARLTRCFFLGSGARYGLACELSLKLKEMSLSESEPFHFLEYRHGPQSMAGANTLIVGLLSQTNRANEDAVLGEMRALGARSIAVGAAGDLVFGQLPEPIAGPLYLPFGQLLAYERATQRGLNPDRPHQLEAVVRLDG